MKKMITRIPVLCSLGLALLVLGGCNQSRTPAPPAATATSASAPTPSSATAFNNVMGMLDENGSVLFYMGTEQMFEVAAEKFEGFRGIMDSLPKEDLDEEELQQIKQVVDYASKVFKRIGISEIAGLGVSGIAVDEELNRSRFVLHHKADGGKGHMWSVLGGEPHEMFGLDMMPANTVFASSQDVDLAGLWRVLDSEIKGFGNEELLEEWDEGKADFEEETGLKIDDLMKSFGGGFSLALTLDEKELIQVPGPDGKPLELPRPELVFTVAVNDGLIFERIKKEVAGDDSGITITNVDGVERIQGPAVFPPIPSLKPLLAFDGKHLFVASSPEALSNALAVKSGEQPGLASTEKFKKLSGLAATKGNGFSYADSRLGEIAQDIQVKIMADAPDEAKALTALMAQFQKPSDMYTSFENTRYGWVWTAVGQQDAAAALLTSVAVAPAALLAGIAVPNFVKARDKAQRIKCVNNLKQLSLGLKIYASDNNDRYPFQVPATDGGTKEQASQTDLGDDMNPFTHLIKLKNELGVPGILTCPAHPNIKPAQDWDELTADHVSYQLRTGEDVTEFNPEEVLIWCPYHHNVARTDGLVLQKEEADTRERRAGSWKVSR